MRIGVAAENKHEHFQLVSVSRWTEDATAARYDHAERVEELRAAVEKAK